MPKPFEPDLTIQPPSIKSLPYTYSGTPTGLNIWDLIADLPELPILKYIDKPNFLPCHNIDDINWPDGKKVK